MIVHRHVGARVDGRSVGHGRRQRIGRCITSIPSVRRIGRRVRRATTGASRSAGVRAGVGASRSPRAGGVGTCVAAGILWRRRRGRVVTAARIRNAACPSASCSAATGGSSASSGSATTDTTDTTSCAGPTRSAGTASSAAPTRSTREARTADAVAAATSRASDAATATAAGRRSTSRTRATRSCISGGLETATGGLGLRVEALASIGPQGTGIIASAAAGRDLRNKRESSEQDQPAIARHYTTGSTFRTKLARRCLTAKRALVPRRWRMLCHWHRPARHSRIGRNPLTDEPSAPRSRKWATCPARASLRYRGASACADPSAARCRSRECA